MGPAMTPPTENLEVPLRLPLMRKPARIFVVASGGHDLAQLAKVPASAGVPVPAWNTPTALAKGNLGLAAANDDAAADRGRRLLVPYPIQYGGEICSFSPKRSDSEGDGSH